MNKLVTTNPNPGAITSTLLVLLCGFFGIYQTSAFAPAVTPFVAKSISSPLVATTTTPLRSSANTDADISTDPSLEEINTKIDECKQILVKAAKTKKEDSETVLGALTDLEKLVRQKAKQSEGNSVGEEMKKSLTGDWRLIFTTGTKNTQKQYGNINYFPIKAVQTFRTQQDPMLITNGIFAGSFPLVKFYGEMDFDVKKRKLEFDFNELLILGFIKLNLGKGEAAQIGASSGLGSESNVENVKKGRQAFFNWISADDNIATARGGGGGLALWKRVDGVHQDLSNQK